MGRGTIALVLGLMIGCHTSGPSDQTGAAVTGSASQCNTADTFDPPTFTLSDFQTILGLVDYYSGGKLADGVTPAFVLLYQVLSGLPWTSWYLSSNMNDALAKLATMRAVLDKYNLHEPYVPGVSPRPVVDCSTVDTTVRQLDGSCDDLVATSAGAAGTRMGRNIPLFLPKPDGTGYLQNPAAYPAGVVPSATQPPATDDQILTPSPREVSRQLFTRPDSGMKPVPFLNLLAAAWIQFQVHDWFDHDNTTALQTGQYFHIPLASDDVLRKFQISELVIPKTTPDPSWSLLQPLPPQYQNLVTHWWDGSQLYGTSAAQANALRAKNADGSLRAELAMDPSGSLLAKAGDGFEQTGFRKNWWIGLGVMHNVFAHEHNAIVAKLRQSHPELTEQQLFDHARMITAAVIAKIHTVEWTPAILPNRTATTGLNANWYGLKRFLDPSQLGALPTFEQQMAQQIIATNDPATAQVKISTALAAINGVLGGATDNHGIPYSLTEEFTSVYRMHPLLPDQIKILSAGKPNKVLAVYKTEQTRNADARSIEEQSGMTNVIYSFGEQNPGALVLGNYPRFIQQLQMPFGVIDMGAVDVLRDRERGLPRYNDFRQQLRLQRVASIEQLTDDPALQAALHNVYGSDPGAIDRVDALVGTFGEATRPSCYGFGETLFQVFTEMATRRLQADRFYTQDFNAATYTQEGLDWIANASFKAVLIRAYPQLANTNLANVQNAFYPWN